MIPANTADAASLPPLGLSLPIQLLRAREAVMQRLRPHFQAHDLTEQQWRVIRALAELQSADIQSLAVVCSIHAPSLSRIIPRLQGHGLITRVSSDADQRRAAIALSAAGWDVFREVGAGIARSFAALEAEIGVAEMELLRQSLQRVIGLAAVGGSVGGGEVATL